jgi:hypothetical protein
MLMLMRRYANIVATAGAKHAFKTSFDIVWDVSHHSTDKGICSTVHRSVAATKCTGNALGFTRAVCVTLHLDLNLWRVSR